MTKIELSSVSAFNFSPRKILDALKDLKELDSKVQEVAIKVLAGMLIGAALGAVAGGLLGAAPIVLMAAAGAGLGLLAGIAFAVVQRCISKAPPKAQPIDGAVLDLFARQCKGLIRMEKALCSVKSVIDRVNKQQPIYLQQSFDNHAFHHAVTVLTDEVKRRPELQKAWGVFLQGLQGLTLGYPDGRWVQLDFSLELERLKGHPVTIHTEKLNQFSSEYDQLVHQISNIEQECFTEGTICSEEQLQSIFRSPQDHCIVARRKETGEVLGFLRYQQEAGSSGRPDWHICGIGRTANSARLGIGEELFQEFMKQISLPRDGSYLEVRASNESAIALYQKYGFKIVGKRPKYYSSPQEDAYLMRFDYAAYLAQQAAQRKAA